MASCAKPRLDEVPQLGNVLLGDLSLVGPRPERPAFVERFSLTIPFYDSRHLVRPRVTGWAQVSFGYADGDIGLCAPLFVAWLCFECNGLAAY